MTVFQDALGGSSGDDPIWAITVTYVVLLQLQNVTRVVLFMVHLKNLVVVIKFELVVM